MVWPYHSKHNNILCGNTDAVWIELTIGIFQLIAAAADKTDKNLTGYLESATVVQSPKKSL